MSHSRSQSLAIGALVAAACLGVYIYYRRRNNDKKRVVFVLGGPGSGKGTQCALISQKYQFEHLSAGDLLRAERKKDTETARVINGCISEGRLVPSEVTTGLLASAIENSPCRNFLIDGFPRNTSNWHCFQKLLSDSCEVSFLLHLECPEDIMIDRLLKRGETSGRVDDNIEVIKARFKTEETETKPIIEHFRAAGRIRTVDSNRSVADVFNDVSLHFDVLR